MTNVIKCVFIIIGTIVGAGFASGQEIATFFNRFESGKLGIMLACIFFGIIIAFILETVAKNKDFDKLIWNKRIIKYMQVSFLAISFCIMIAGIGAFFKEQMGINEWLGALVGCIICFIVFSFKYKGLELANVLLVPIIIIGMIMIGCAEYNVETIGETNSMPQNFFTNSYFVSCLLYVGYNSLILIPVLITFKYYNLSKIHNYVIAFLSFTILIFISVNLFDVINIYYPQILAFEIPTLKLASLNGEMSGILYGIVILFSIFTTAISSGFSFLETNKSKYMKNNILLCISAFIVSNIGFSKLIETLFPIFGYIGLIYIAIIFLEYMIYYKKHR